MAKQKENTMAKTGMQLPGEIVMLEPGHHGRDCVRGEGLARRRSYPTRKGAPTVFVATGGNLRIRWLPGREAGR